MAKEIPSELKEFKEKLNGKLSSISSTTSDITSKISDLASASTTAASAVATNYQSSDAVNVAVSKLSSAAEFMNIIKSDITTTVNSAVTKANSVIEKVNKLESIINDIKAQENKISNERAKDEPSQSVISSANSEIDKKNKEFDEVVEEAKAEIAALKALDKTVSTAKTPGATGTTTDTNVESGSEGQSTLQTYTQYLDNLKYGTFVKSVYTSPSTKYKMNYYLYLPDGYQNIQGLPTMVYLHGGNKTGTGMGSLTEYGLCPMIGKKQVTPQGIVILPHIADFEQGNSEAIQRTIMELTTETVKKYNGDPKRVSLAGHSYGAIIGYKMINEHPGYFSAFVPISGWNKLTNEFKNVKVWAFHGDRDNRGNGSRTTYPGACQTVDQINAMGGQAKITTLKGMGHSHVQDKVLEQTFTSPDGKQENYVDWAMRQVRS